MTSTDLETYEQAIAFQTRLVRRAVLPRVQHDIVDAYETVVNTLCVHCACGEWLQFPVAGSEQLYGRHIARAVRQAVAA